MTGWGLYGAECSRCQLWAQKPARTPLEALSALCEQHEMAGRDVERCREEWWLVHVGKGANPQFPHALGEHRSQPYKGDVVGQRVHRGRKKPT